MNPSLTNSNLFSMMDALVSGTSSTNFIKNLGLKVWPTEDAVDLCFSVFTRLFSPF